MISIQSAKKWHLLLVWPAIISVLIYTLSALTHPLMAWTGPQAEKRFPPRLIIPSDNINSVSKIIKNNKLTSAKVAKFVPFKEQVLLQITENETSPRRYFSTIDFKEQNAHDERQAIWLAQYYLSANYKINNIEMKTEFDTEYPSVNRLLPVYKINYETEDSLTVFIHTETQTMADISNDWKRSLKRVFQLFHTFTWLNDYEAIRLILTSIIVSIITLMAITSFIFIIGINRNSIIKDTKRRWHRRLAYVVTVPLFLFSISGIYHLLHASLSESVAGMGLTKNLNLSHWQAVNIDSNKLPTNMGQISLINIPAELHYQRLQKPIPTNHKTNYPYYRISSLGNAHNNAADNNHNHAGKPLDNKNTRLKRFNGTALESKVNYINAEGSPDNSTDNSSNSHHDFDKALDKLLVAQQAKALLKSNNPKLELISHFGPKYDFRNKRLPVWMAQGENGHRVFIDPVNQILVDRTNLAAQLEGYSFSFLHKWSLLSPILGRFKRDLLIMTILALTILLTAFGLAMHLNNRKVK
jgi:hypothetical protein